MVEAMPPARILVVADEGALAFDLRASLEGRGYSVPAVVPRAEEALRRLEELQPDLVLMDLCPGGKMDGVEAARRIRAWRDVPVVYLCADAEPAVEERTRGTEPYGYLLGPFDDRQLQVAIGVALRRHALERQLRENERWLTAAMRCIGECVIAADERWRIRFMSRAAERLTGWSVEEARDRDLAEILPVSLHPGPPPLAAGTPAGTGSARGVLRPRGGLPVPVEERSSLIRDEAGHVVGIVVALRELVDRGRAEPGLAGPGGEAAD